MGIPGSSIPRDNRLRGWPCSTWSWALFVFVFLFIFCWFFGTPADGCRHGHINPASCLDWWRCGCRSLLAVAAALATSHLPKLEYPVKRNENRSNQAENTHTCCPRRGGGEGGNLQGGQHSHIDMQMNVTILNEIIVLNEGSTAAAPVGDPIPITIPIPIPIPSSPISIPIPTIYML